MARTVPDPIVQTVSATLLRLSAAEAADATSSPTIATVAAQDPMSCNPDSRRTLGILAAYPALLDFGADENARR